MERPYADIALDEEVGRLVCEDEIRLDKPDGLPPYLGEVRTEAMERSLREQARIFARFSAELAMMVVGDDDDHDDDHDDDDVHDDEGVAAVLIAAAAAVVVVVVGGGGGGGGGSDDDDVRIGP
eukprot:2875855-Rhodomonas_salina.1